MKPVIIEHPLGDYPPEAHLYYGMDNLKALRLIPDETIQCCVTSPPYWGLRDYRSDPIIWGGDNDCDHVWGEEGKSSQRNRNKSKGTGLRSSGDGGDESWSKGQATLHPSTGCFCRKCGAWLGQLGLEPTPYQYVANLVEIFREVRRVLRPDGTLWLNLGDSYAGSWGNFGTRPELDGTPSNQRDKQVDYWKRGGWDQRRVAPPSSKRIPGIKPKDLIGIPWRVALALQEDGWWLRSDILWIKPNPLPESVQDRPSKAHEYIFLLTKSPRYFYDKYAVAEPSTRPGDTQPIGNNAQRDLVTENDPNYRRGTEHWGNPVTAGPTRNRRTTWEISTESYPGAHFAVMPSKLADLCVKAGTSEKGNCRNCGAPWRRVITKGEILTTGGSDTGARASNLDKVSPLKEFDNPQAAYNTGRMAQRKDVMAGWEPSCDCDDPTPERGIVLDPFSGSGTTGVVALKNRQSFIGIDLNEEYLPLAEDRISGQKSPPSNDEDDENPVLDLFGLP